MCILNTGTVLMPYTWALHIEKFFQGWILTEGGDTGSGIWNIGGKNVECGVKSKTMPHPSFPMLHPSVPMPHTPFPDSAPPFLSH